MKILITGPQGAGKTTQAEIISQKLGLCLINMGQLLRERAAENDLIGQKLTSDMNQGIHVNNQFAAQIIENQVNGPKCANGFLIDGYPRNMDQLNYFDPKYDTVIYLDVSVETSIDRLLKRGRSDDTPEAIKQRLELFDQETQKTVNFYENQGKVVRINGEQSIEQVTTEILNALKEHDNQTTN